MSRTALDHELQTYVNYVAEIFDDNKLSDSDMILKLGKILMDANKQIKELKIEIENYKNNTKPDICMFIDE